MSEPLSVTLDGPVASGKTVVGGLVARRLGWRFLDTGVMYRAVTWAALQRSVPLDNEQALTKLAEGVDMELVAGNDGDRLLVDGVDVTGNLRDSEVEHEVSLVSRVGGVRSALVGIQQTMARLGPIVMAGRDIGTVVLPEAAVKVFLNASAEVRAKRRFQEMAAAGGEPDYQRVLGDLIRRDSIDSQRKDSPLRPADDAVQIDTDDLDTDQVAERILKVVETRR